MSVKLGLTLRPNSSSGVDVVVFGENSLDTVVVVREPGDASKRRASSITEMVGGQSATSAVGCARLGWRTKYAGVIGDDAAGALVRQTLAAERVEAVLASREGAVTRRAVVLVDESSGDRRVFERRDSQINARAGEFRDE